MKHHLETISRTSLPNQSTVCVRSDDNDRVMARITVVTVSDGTLEIGVVSNEGPVRITASASNAISIRSGGGE